MILDQIALHLVQLPLLMRSDNHSLFALTNELVAETLVVTREMWNLKGEVATMWTVLCDFTVARDSKLDWSQ